MRLSGGKKQVNRALAFSHISMYIVRGTDRRAFPTPNAQQSLRSAIQHGMGNKTEHVLVFLNTLIHISMAAGACATNGLGSGQYIAFRGIVESHSFARIQEPTLFLSAKLLPRYFLNIGLRSVFRAYYHYYCGLSES